MKKFIIAFALLVGLSSFNSTTDAQNINVSINIGSQPAWGPVGYDYAGYYYFPDIDCYYDVNMGMYYYYDRGVWVSARYLPYAYRNYDLYGLYKVVLNVNRPWRYNSIHRRDYGRYVGYRNQMVIRDSRDYRYRDSRRNNVVWYNSRPSNGYNQNHIGRPNNSGMNRPDYNRPSRPNSDGHMNRPNDNRPSNNQSNNKPNNSNRPNNSRPNSNSNGSINRPDRGSDNSKQGTYVNVNDSRSSNSRSSGRGR